MDEIATDVIDPAKSIVSVHEVDARGRIALHKTLGPARLMALVARLPT